MSATPSRGSAAWITAIVSVLMFLIAAILLTFVDPVLQTLFDSSLFTSSTAPGATTLRRIQNLWGFFPVAILIAITLTVWIKTRRPG